MEEEQEEDLWELCYHVLASDIETIEHDRGTAEQTN